MSDRGTDGVRGVVLPTLLCSLVCGGCVLAMALVAVLALGGPPVRPVTAPAVPAPAPVAAAPVPPPPPVTEAPTGQTFTVQLAHP
jgi:hypothetical protein